MPFLKKSRAWILLIIMLSIFSGCSGTSPLAPGQIEYPADRNPAQSDRLIYGSWHIDIDTELQTAVAIPLRETAFHINATYSLENPTQNIIVEILAIDAGTGNMAIRVALVHPETEPVFRAFDVRGIVFTNSSWDNWNDPGLVLPQSGDPLFLRNPDGYTRWWNPAEFSSGGPSPVSKYVNGKLAHPYTGSGDYDYNGTVNPYKYFIIGHPDAFTPSDPYNLNDGLDMVDYFSDPANFADQATLPVGSICSRIYQFKMNGDFLSHLGFNYAVDGCWAAPVDLVNPELEDFPPKAHMPEPFLIDMSIEKNTLFYLEETTFGGVLSLLVDVYDWQNYDDDGFFEYTSPAEGIHGAISILGDNGFLDGETPVVEFVDSDPDIRRMTYRLTFTNPVIPGLGLYDIMLVVEHSRTYPATFASVDNIFVATYKPFAQSIIVLPVIPEPFELPYDDPMNLTTDNFWTVIEYKKSPPYQPASPQPSLTDESYYHWGLSDSNETWSSQVHYNGSSQVQNPVGYADLMRNALISPTMVFPDSGSICVTIEHTFSMEPFDDFGEMVFLWADGMGGYTYYPMYFYHFTGELPGNTSGITDGARTDTFIIDKLTTIVGGIVQTFIPAPGGEFRLAFLFDSDADNNEPYLGWEIDSFSVHEAIPYDDPGMTEVFDEHFDSVFASQAQWDFIDAGTGGQYWGIIDLAFPGNDGTFLDAAYELSSVYDSGINEEAVLTVAIPSSGQVMMKIRHRISVDPGVRAFIAVDEVDGDNPGDEFEVLYPCYAGGLLPYTFTRGTEFAGVINPGGDNNVVHGWGHFCWTGRLPEDFDTTDDLDEVISSFFDLTRYAGSEIELRFIFRTSDEIIDPFYPFTSTDYRSWRIEQVTIKAS